MTEEKKKIEEAVSIILRGIDIESSALILEKVVMDNYIISVGRVNILRVATRQILNFIEDYKNKDYLKVIKEKVKSNEEVTKLQKENEEKDKYIKNSDKQIDLMAKYIAKLDIYEGICIKVEDSCHDYAGQNGKTCDNCIKQFFEKLAKEKGE